MSCYHCLLAMSANVPFRQLEAVSLAEGVVAALKDAFFSGALKPGAAIVERQIAMQMNVGTPVVREALISLKHEGFVRRVKNKGTFITAFETDEVRQLYTLRVELETLALQWARPLVTKVRCRSAEESGGSPGRGRAAGESARVPGM